MLIAILMILAIVVVSYFVFGGFAETIGQLIRAHRQSGMPYRQLINPAIREAKQKFSGK
ncbi:hypothetical protein FC15_GL000784 [Lapidilactobacillus concavus DSM 17758]|uniref:Uncharacterized protein n=1 Tax=Lapidilactobacillus concavus DSM 17758 TaxID=1423735 RepID=A0A0R1VZ23_9LACO|nr:hypothetical protein [Lapidilactobacillus concavus]KRM08102.1 hypothetical protein FC15_GL000784 [Lapidilactobacillus concavus DSM 17758]GEL12982.1 hypothetical protein LCO01nite_05310 [Lapidilactobacillus concavus]